MPVKIPSTTLRDAVTHEVAAGCVRCIGSRPALAPPKVIENVTPTTVIIEPAIVDNIPRAPSALAPNRRGQRASHWALPVECASTKAIARVMLPATISVGTKPKTRRQSTSNTV